MTEEYFQWLYSLVGKDSREYGHYWRLMRQLFSREFHYIVKNDDNRSNDGILLREIFAKDYGYSVEDVETEINGPCRVLEMLVGLSVRINDELMWDPDKGNRTAFWFWKIMSNAGLMSKEFQDGYYNGESMMLVHKILDRILNREYLKNGWGGLFPLKNPTKDQRKVEIWYQLDRWLDENYPLDPNKIG